MKNKILFFVLAFVGLLGMSVSASKKSPKTSAPSSLSSFSGVVIDQRTKEKLAGVTIQMSETDLKIYSDTKGEFILAGVEPGTYKVKINCISYKDKEVTVKVSKTQTDKLRIVLHPIEP